uniref:Membrane-spanning 4-domains, subfamily A, member 17C.1 n=1 Tax=Cyprinus carpio TaxID=7962 RepID=A0A8C1IY34_CYPCA
MESSKVVSTDKPTVFIEVNPKVIQDTVIFFDGHEAGGKNHTTALKGFLKAQPKALGTVQIMIGVMVFLLGIVLTANFYIFSTISVISGITIWGSFIYISTGSLSVAAQNKLHPCVLKASLGMNVISAITAGISIILMGADIGITTQERPNCRYGYDCLIPQGFGSGILGILLVFSILQLIISIFISAFACKATSSTDSTVVNVAVNQGY